MMELQFIINGNIVPYPENAGELEIELNYDKDAIGDLKTSVNQWKWEGANAELINNHVANGLLNGVGIFEGLPFIINITNKGEIINVYDGYIDLVEQTEFSCNEITVTTKEAQSIDWLNDVSDSVSFEYLYEIGAITSADFKYMKYIVSTVPNTKDAIITIVAAIFIIIQIEQEVTRITQLVASSANPFEATSIPRLILELVYVTLLIASLIKLLTAIKQYIIQSVKYHAGMLLNDLLTKGCAHFGLKFQSTLIQGGILANALIIPPKYELIDSDTSVNIFKSNNTNSGIKGFYKKNASKQRGYYKGTFGELLRAVKTMLRAKVIIKNGVLMLEKENYKSTNKLFKIPNLRNDYWQLNTDEMKSNYLLSFQTDLNDKNTIDRYKGTNYQVIQRPIITANPKYLLLKHLERVDIPFALAKNKKSLTVPETIFNVVCDIVTPIIQTIENVVNGAINAINKVIQIIENIIKILKNLGIKIKIKGLKKIKNVSYDKPEKVEQRIDMMLIENDFIDVHKICIYDPANEKLNPLNESLLTAKYLWDNYHYTTSFAEVNGMHNQYYKYDYKNVPFTFENFKQVKDDNIIVSADGEEARLDTCKWRPLQQNADIKFRINRKYTNNLTITTIEPDGN